MYLRSAQKAAHAERSSELLHVGHVEEVVGRAVEGQLQIGSLAGARLQHGCHLVLVAPAHERRQHQGAVQRPRDRQ